MPLSFGPALSNYTSLRYSIILAVEESGVPSPWVYIDGNHYATIGVGFLVGAQARAILIGMGYGGDPNLAAYALAIENAVAPSGHRVFASHAAAQWALVSYVPLMRRRVSLLVSPALRRVILRSRLTRAWIPRTTVPSRAG